MPKNGWLPNGVGKLLIVKFQIWPAELLRMLNNAMKATTWLRTGAFWIGRNSTRSIRTPATNDTMTVSTKATQ